MSQKFFVNPFEDYNEAEDHIPDMGIVPRYCTCIEDRWRSTEEQFQNLDFKDYSVYTGTSGYALLKLKKEPNIPKNLKEIKKLLCLDKLKGRRHTFLCGDAGPLAIGIVINDKLGKHEEVEHLLGKLTSLGRDVLNIQSDLPNEYLYGRAGYLYAILYVNENVSPPPFEDQLITQLIEAILVCGRDVAKAGCFKCPLMYQWHDSYYLGAAHGLAGILYLLLQARSYIAETDLNNVIRPTIEYLLTQRFPSGNFPSSIGREADKYMQWCHGAPGFVYLLTTAYKVFQDTKYLQAALECGDVIWERGLIKKGYSLCHGVSGNGYCFLELYQTTQERKHLYRATRFAEWCLNKVNEHEELSPDRPLSLFEGIAGPMYFLLDMQQPMEAKFPGFSLSYI
ncbi:unnamed protein product [Phyllotreta striolata]|uniref:LanC-like protein 2 n=1 Tax=Phyllotreta striolata TaxID=444603 RepID=A0A9N9XQV1_PHYSR|nr:unnamed protein product [Phyllotreta striolata]